MELPTVSTPIKNHKHKHRWSTTVFRKTQAILNPPLHHKYENPFPALPLVMQLVLIGISGSIILGYNLSVLNTAMPIITANFKWCAHDSRGGEESIGWELLSCEDAKLRQFLISASLIVGAAVGTLYAGSFMSHIGRRVSLILIHIGFATTGLLASLSMGFTSLFVGRLLTGLFCGLSSVASPLYLIEMAHPQQREIYGLLPTIGTNFGILLGIIVGIRFNYPTRELALGLDDWASNTLWWRYMLSVVPLLLSLCTALSLLKMYPFDTPEATRLSGRSSKAIEGVLWFPSSQGTTAIRAAERPTTRQHPTSLLVAMRLPALRLRLLKGTIVAIMQQFSGIAVFLVLSNSLFSEAGVPSRYLTMASAAMAVLQLVFSVLAAPLLKSCPRKQLLGIGSLVMGLVLLPTVLTGSFPINGSWSQYSSIFSVLAFTSIYGLTFGPGLLVYLNELFSADIRDAGLSIAFAFNWVASFISIFIASILTPFQDFTLFAGACVCTAFFILFCCPETKVLTGKDEVLTRCHHPSVDIECAVDVSPKHRQSSSRNTSLSTEGGDSTTKQNVVTVIGLTGGIGSGKSTCARALEAEGALVLDADKLGHQAYASGSPLIPKLIEMFGSHIVDPSNGEVNRALLGSLVFGQPERLKQLTALVWPEIKRSLETSLARSRSERSPMRHTHSRYRHVVLIDAAVLIEAEWVSLTDHVVLLNLSNTSEIQRRVRLRNPNMSDDDIAKRVSSQMPVDRRLELLQTSQVPITVINAEKPQQEVINDFYAAVDFSLRHRTTDQNQGVRSRTE